MRKIKNNVSIKISIALIISMFIISISTIIQAKYIFQNEFYIANLNIDRTKPKIELVSIDNTNTSYKGYANKTHTITIKVKITDKNLKKVTLDKDHVKIKINDKYNDNAKIQSKKIQDTTGGVIYQIELSNLDGNGNLKVDFLEGTAIDTGELKSELLEINTNIIIDNIAPKGSFAENKISDGKVKATISLSEKIKELDGWNFSSDKLKAEKEFTNNISYELPIVDYAGNKTIIDVNITQATYINIIYASHNSVVGWSFGYGNYDVAGKDAIETNKIYKTEALAFNVSGNVDADFLQAKAYIYTYWGKGSYGRCTTSGILYNYGYNPLDRSYKSMKSTDLVTIDNKKYFQLGGSGINSYGNGDANGNNCIPKEIAPQYIYGVSGVNFKLKDYSQFSVVYQILVDNAGWIKTCADGQECMYDKDKPMSAFRIALIPKSEKQYVIDTWNKDVGTFNLK